MRLPIALLLLATSVPAFAQGKPCAAPERHQFDFWIGEWSVTNPAGQPAGESSITAIADGCAISEHWRGAKGSDG